MKIAIMQPTYLPWIGYFAMMDEVDVFVLLDDVQFDHRSWQQRNRVLVGGEAHTLTVPVLRKESSSPFIRDVLLGNDRRWRKKHLGVLERNYSRATFGKEAIAIVKRILELPIKTIGELNAELIMEFARQLEIDTKVVHSSDLQSHGVKAEKLLEITLKIGADVYCSPQGSFAYLDEDPCFSQAGVSLEYFNYEHPSYRQMSDKFVSHLSAFDIIANEGPASRDIIRSGFRMPLSHNTVRELRSHSDDTESKK